MRTSPRRWCSSRRTARSPARRAFPHSKSSRAEGRIARPQRRSRDARVRGDGARQDPHAGRPRRPAEGLAGQGAAGAQRREPRPARGGSRMTAPDSGKRPSMMETVQTTDGFLRHAGRDFLIVLYTAFRSLKLYPIENTQVQKALDDLAATTKQLLDVERELEIRMQGE